MVVIGLWGSKRRPNIPYSSKTRCISTRLTSQWCRHRDQRCGKPRTEINLTNEKVLQAICSADRAEHRAELVDVEAAATGTLEGRQQSSNLPCSAFASLGAQLRAWRRQTPYAKDADFVFPSFRARAEFPFPLRFSSPTTFDRLQRRPEFRSGTVNGSDFTIFATRCLTGW